jgi:PTH1 family peptidyl-tRNA hydrolase
MKLIVGLGNPGSKYARTRHNAGVWAVEAIAEKYGFSAWGKKYDGLWCEGKIGEQKIAALLPQTFMNLSGQSVRAAQVKERIALPDIIIFHDELDALVGKVKAKLGGGAGGHNGLKSIDALIGKDYARIRIGIGHPGNPDLVSDYVLGVPKPDERDAIQKVIDALALKCDALLGEKTDIAIYMNHVGLLLNPKPLKPAKRVDEKAGEA